MSLARASLGLRVRTLAPSAAVARRFNSTSASTSTATDEVPPNYTSPRDLPMTWSDYLAMRKRRRQWSSITSIPTSLGGLIGGAMYFASKDVDPTQLIFGFDPYMVYGGATFACMAFGWLLGPTVGNALFGVTHPKLSKGNPSPLEVMDREFFNRIKSRRVDPSRQSMNNPSPDFYGEKITSIPAYRQWLKDQKAYAAKVSHGVPDEL
ncbi:integral to membrane protein [Trichosporon asahii var. asahii CBS 8904]|uniref:Presequence translocated-associated motor subunit PAM17 n=2 Tax=Trichosporon asahii var. asahii TaxID=189963 RepID=K1VSM0_TRIAC|nr:integral to membrane protein [Trichosporon asahii var. asahii CBS 2479]EJT51330.1 integral to membrane protein [Trichosporon asahii var. asahii CBS 2479]EKC99622.1 integral to membrane protein [Trichosporon asahii var. asahii CBS 8904]